MATTRTEIRGWLERAQEEGATHVIVVCDTFDYEDFPVLVMPNQDVRAVYWDRRSEEMQRIMEVYALHRDFDVQLNEHRAFHFERAGERPVTLEEVERDGPPRDANRPGS